MSTSCQPLIDNASEGVASALRAVDCMSAETTAQAFGHLFAHGGALLPVLTALLTLAIGFFALALLTGRARLGIAALTPRMLSIGLVLTFATSWIAYQSVVWNLATGAPDQIAGVVIGQKGPSASNSASESFAHRIDVLMNAIAETAEEAQPTGGEQAQKQSTGVQAGSFTPTNLMWMAAVLLMLGTVGVLVTARIALAVLLATGPLFIVLALFTATRGLFAGWLRAVVLTSVTPLVAVLGGAFMTELALPVVVRLRGIDGIEGRPAMALFTIAAVHCALMLLAIKVTATMVSGWRVFGLARPATREPSAPALAPAMPAPYALRSAGTASTAVSRTILASQAMAETAPSSLPASTRIVPLVPASSPIARLPPPRSRGIGSRFLTPPSATILGRELPR